MLRTPVVHLNITYSKPNERFLGHNVMVTGGSSGIGLAIAKAFLSEGARVLICARNQKGLDEVAGKINSDHLYTMPLDISKVDYMEQNICKAIEIMGSIDIFINAAGVSAYCGDIMTEEMYDYICALIPQHN